MVLPDSRVALQAITPAELTHAFEKGLSREGHLQAGSQATIWVGFSSDLLLVR